MDELEAHLRTELDLSEEASNTELIGRIVGGSEHLVVPEVMRPWVTERVLVLELVRGEKIEPGHGLPAERAQELARASFRAYVRQVTLEGVYHADPHRGNVLLTEDGRLCLLDFGLIGRLADDTRRRLALRSSWAAGSGAGKTLAQADTIARTLDPELDPVELIEDGALDVILGETARRLEPNQLLSFLFTQLDPLGRYPRKLGQLLSRLEAGTLKVGIAPKDLGGLDALLRTTVNRLGAALIVVGLLISWR